MQQENNAARNSMALIHVLQKIILILIFSEIAREAKTNGDDRKLFA